MTTIDITLRDEEAHEKIGDCVQRLNAQQNTNYMLGQTVAAHASTLSKQGERLDAHIGTLRRHDKKLSEVNGDTHDRLRRLELRLQNEFVGSGNDTLHVLGEIPEQIRSLFERVNTLKNRFDSQPPERKAEPVVQQTLTWFPAGICKPPADRRVLVRRTVRFAPSRLTRIQYFAATWDGERWQSGGRIPIPHGVTHYAYFNIPEGTNE